MAKVPGKCECKSRSVAMFFRVVVFCCRILLSDFITDVCSYFGSRQTIARTISAVCKDQRPLSLAWLATWHYGNAGWDQSSYATVKARPNPTSLLRIHKKANFFSRLNNKMNGPCPGDPVEA